MQGEQGTEHRALDGRDWEQEVAIQKFLTTQRTIEGFEDHLG